MNIENIEKNVRLLWHNVGFCCAKVGATPTLCAPKKIIAKRLKISLALFGRDTKQGKNGLDLKHRVIPPILFSFLYVRNE
jgi:hypothetical protein